LCGRDARTTLATSSFKRTRAKCGARVSRAGGPQWATEIPGGFVTEWGLANGPLPLIAFDSDSDCDTDSEHPSESETETDTDAGGDTIPVNE